VAMTLDQQRAIALASARKRAMEGKSAAPQEGRIPIISDINDFSNSFRTGVTQGMTLGFADELQAGVEAPFRAIGDTFSGKGFDLGRSFNEGLDNVRGVTADMTAKNEGAALAGDVLGSVITGGGLAGKGLTLMKAAKPTVASMATRGAIEGAGYGAVSGFGRSEGDSIEARGRDALTGAMWGAGAGGAIGGVAGKLASNAAAKAVPTVQDLKKQAGDLYTKASERGFMFGQPQVKSVSDDIARLAAEEGLDPTLHPGATAALKRLQQFASPTKSATDWNGDIISVPNTGAKMSVDEAKTIRRILAAAGKDYTNPDQSRIAGKMLDKFDDFLEAGAPELKDARGLYSQAKKGELIEKTIELAGSRAGQFSGSGYENALRTEFRALERKIIEGQIKGLSQEEIDAISKVARGGPIENVMRYVGKLAPTGVVSFGAGAGVPFMVGNAVGGPGMGAAAAGATMGAGFLGRSAATALTKGNAVRAALLARSGGVAPAATIPGPTSKVMQALIAAGGNEASRIPLEITVGGRR